MTNDTWHSHLNLNLSLVQRAVHNMQRIWIYAYLDQRIDTLNRSLSNRTERHIFQVIFSFFLHFYFNQYRWTEWIKSRWSNLACLLGERKISPNIGNWLDYRRMMQQVVIYQFLLFSLYILTFNSCDNFLGYRQNRLSVHWWWHSNFSNAVAVWKLRTNIHR